MSVAERAVATAALLAILGRTLPAAAQTGTTQGEQLFQQGRAALSEGKYEVARDYFEQSHKLDPALGTLLNLAVCEEKLGRLTTALAHLGDALAAASPSDRRRPLIAARLAEIDRRTPRLTIHVDATLDPDVVVSLDSRPLDRTDLGKPMHVDPGRHELGCVASTGERCARRTFTVSETTESVETVTALAPSPPAPVLATQQAPPPPVPSARLRSSVAYGLGALGIAGIGAGLLTGALVIERKNTVDRRCDPTGCDQVGLDAAESGKTLSLISTVTTAVGVVALGSSVILLLSAPSSKSSTTALSVSGAF